MSFLKIKAQSAHDDTSSSNVPGAKTSGPLRILEPVSNVVPLVPLDLSKLFQAASLQRHLQLTSLLPSLRHNGLLQGSH